MTIAKIATAAFDLEDYITGSRTGGVEAPRIILSVKEHSNVVDIEYTYPETCGLSDCRYHDTRAGKIYTTSYMMDGRKLYILRDSKWDAEILGETWDEWELEQFRRFCYEYGLCPVDHTAIRDAVWH